MQPSGYSPYQHREPKKKLPFKLPKVSGGFKKWLLIVLAVLFGFFFVIYLTLGDLRFFANNYLRLTFFKKDYLILFQNNYESRPTGGFLTGYGEVSTSFGFISDLEFHNSYEIDTDTYVTPPYPHEELLKNEWYEGYTFRDANWNPHFPGSAETLIDFYQQKFPEKEVDGIIVVNFSVIENLVEKLGGIELDGKMLTRSNLFKEITHEVNDVDRHDETALMERKDILSELALRLIPKAKWHPFKSREVVEEALASKDIYFWFKSKGLQKKVEKKGWANTLTMAEQADFLHVNLANLGSKKVDRYLIKEVYHHANLAHEIPEITTEIVLRYPGSTSQFADNYKGYLRLYIPAQAELISDPLGAEQTIEGGYKVISTQVILPAGSRTTISYTYTLPRTLLPTGEYRLRIVKQSGDDKNYTLTMEGYPDSELSSDDFEIREHRALWQGKLQGDIDLDLQVLPDTSAPYPIEQVFENLETIAIYWNEPLEAGPGNDATNYEIIDANVTDESVTDEVKVVYAEVVDGSVSKLEVSGITDQELERYKITLKNLRDLSGNPITPDPKEITVVQRIPEAAEVSEN